MNIIIPLKDFSIHDNIELRYCLRSIEKYLTGYDDIYIVTKQLPKWVKNVKHIYATDTKQKEYNIAHKLITALTSINTITDFNPLSVKESRNILSREDFIYMNDDHFLLAPLKKIPYYYSGKIQEVINSRKPGDSWRITMQNTLKHLIDNNRATNNFDMHFPIVINKHNFLSMMRIIDWSKPYGYGHKSLYCNMHFIKGEYLQDNKIKKASEFKDDMKFFSTTDSYIDKDMKALFERLYNLPSRYEK